MSSFFFNGRLYITPTTVSAVNDNALINNNLSVGNVVAYIGQSSGGKPNTVLTFGSAAEALATLRTGELAQACAKAFPPSDEVGGPATVLAIRVNPATQASLTVNDSASAASINISSADWGAYNNQIKVSFAAGSVQGIEATTQLGTQIYSQDNLYNSPFSVVYTGGQSTSTVTITGTTLVLNAPAGTVVQTIQLANFPTVQQLVDNINSFAGFSAAVIGANGQQPTLQGLDFVTAQSIKTTAFDVTATLQAVINWLNGGTEPFVTATRANGAGKPPAALSATYLSGGSDGNTTNTQWGNAFTTLQAVPVQWITPLSADPSIAAMCDAHVQFMSTVGRSERRALCGTALSTTDTQAIAAALALNSDRTSLVHIGYYDFDLTNQVSGLVLYSPYMAAAVAAAAFCGVSPATPLTNKSLTFRGVERAVLNPTETDPLLQGGLFCIESTPKGFKVVQSISTWLNDGRYDKVEQSVGWGYDFVSQNVRNALDQLRGKKNSPLLDSQAVAITESQLRLMAVAEPQGPGILVGDADSPPYLGITASSSGDALEVSFQASVALPANYIAITIYAQVFSGSASASA